MSWVSWDCQISHLHMHDLSLLFGFLTAWCWLPREYPKSKYAKRVQWLLYFPFFPLEVMQHHFSHIQLITINSLSPAQIQGEGNYPLPLVGSVARSYCRTVREMGASVATFGKYNVPTGFSSSKHFVSSELCDTWPFVSMELLF